jgi:periplasmic protein TonB
VAFEAFTRKDGGGALHQRRAIAYAAAACVLVGLGIASAALKSKELPPPPPKEPEPVEVQLEEKIEEQKPPEPSPEPPPVEVPKHVKVSAAPPPPPPPDPDPNLKAKLDEKDPSKDVGAAGAHGGSSTGKPVATAKPEAPACGGAGQACCAGSCSAGLACEANVCRTPAPVVQKTEVKKPALVSEDDVPAKALSTPPPAYPASARTAGITGKVVVRLTIDEHGNVKDAKIAKGDPNFDDVVLAAVKGWKYEPAKHQDGKPFLSIKTVAIPFKIKM